MSPENLGNGNGVSGGDVVPLEEVTYELGYEPTSNDEITEEASEASRRLIDESDIDTLVAEEQKSDNEKIYERFADIVDKKMDQGLDGEAEWYKLDPNRIVRNAHDAEELAKKSALQDAINEPGAEFSHQERQDARLAVIEQIKDPIAREAARRTFLAREAARIANKGKRA